MARVLALSAVFLILGAGCGEKEVDDTNTASDSDDSSGSDTAGGEQFCTCEDASLSAISGCENFGGDEEQCSGWASCEEENNLGVGSSHADGTQLTCFGCTIEINCR
ncbi:MAG: hypothetical protein H6741_04855 [Alphaproteobacteria bacterium]|nr:hypothetical protein [Alphaproteobacteria bacterium]MCB9792038.1 hypothetical protein [Alphaproteobacteria bacterium]